LPSPGEAGASNRQERRPVHSRVGAAGRRWLLCLLVTGAASLAWGCGSTRGGAPLITHGSVALPEKVLVDPELDPAVLEARGAIIGDILVVTAEVFDTNRPEENRALFRLANRLHPVTRPGVVEQLLTFRSGEPFSRQAMAESERALRATQFLYDARIRPVRLRDGRVDVEVVTRDMWTLKANAAFKRSGGENSTRFSIEDSNFLGSGKDFMLDRTSDLERDSFLYRYRDLSFLGSRTKLELWYSDNSDGELRRMKVEQPFYALDAKWAFGVHVKSDDRVDPLYTLGKVVQRFRHRETLVESHFGLGRPQEDASVHRWRLGFTYHDHLFEPAPGFQPRAALPRDRRLAYPWIGYHYLADRFILTRNLDRIDRSEDVNLGLDFQTRIGYSTGMLGGRENSLLASSTASWGVTPGSNSLLRLELRAGGRLDDGEAANVQVGGSARFYRRTNWLDSVFFARLDLDATHRRDPETQLLLGGDSGLRGYPVRYQDGDRRVLLTLEQRFYTDWNILQLFNVGGAVFFDAGKAWFDGPGARYSEGVLKDVGIGLRLSNSRSSSATMVHIDLAFPLDRARGMDSYQIVVRTSDTF
jgi:hypothetical protein